MNKYDDIYMSLTKQVDDIMDFSSLCMLDAIQEERELGQDSTSKKRLAITSTITALKNAIAEAEQELEDYENDKP